MYYIDIYTYFNNNATVGYVLIKTVQNTIKVCYKMATSGTKISSKVLPPHLNTRNVLILNKMI